MHPLVALYLRYATRAAVNRFGDLSQVPTNTFQVLFFKSLSLMSTKVPDKNTERYTPIG